MLYRTQSIATYEHACSAVSTKLMGIHGNHASNGGALHKRCSPDDGDLWGGQGMHRQHQELAKQCGVDDNGAGMAGTPTAMTN